MIEIFKTNVQERRHANMLIKHIHASFSTYEANFDLHDCDNILRIKSSVGTVEHGSVIELVRNYGFKAELLPDIIMRPFPAGL